MRKKGWKRKVCAGTGVKSLIPFLLSCRRLFLLSTMKEVLSERIVREREREKSRRRHKREKTLTLRVLLSCNSLTLQFHYRQYIGRDRGRERREYILFSSLFRVSSSSFFLSLSLSDVTPGIVIVAVPVIFFLYCSFPLSFPKDWCCRCFLTSKK